MPRTEPLKLSRPFEPVTERLRLRQWQARDFEPFAELGSVPRVMEFDHEST
jgi:RimJ/RimL family protein N-acetyltransferase